MIAVAVAGSAFTCASESTELMSAEPNAYNVLVKMINSLDTTKAYWLIYNTNMINIRSYAQNDDLAVMAQATSISLTAPPCQFPVKFGPSSSPTGAAVNPMTFQPVASTSEAAWPGTDDASPTRKPLDVRWSTVKTSKEALLHDLGGSLYHAHPFRLKWGSLIMVFRCGRKQARPSKVKTKREIPSS